MRVSVRGPAKHADVMYISYQLVPVHCGKVAGKIVCNHGAQTFETMAIVGL
jgi:hypothetical protein